jgi:hypothetical protein
MDVIDDNGNVFGVVNVIDALAVLFVLAVAVAGAALVLQPDPEGPETATTNVTLDLGAQPTYIVSEITAGDTYRAGQNSQLTLMDVYLTPQGGRTRVIVRAQVQGLARGGVSYANAPLRLGRSLEVATNRYQVTGQLRDVGRNDTLSRASTTVVLRDQLSAADARDLAAGDEIRVAGRTVATIEDVAVYATNNPTRRDVFVEATLETYRSQGERRFGGSQMRRGQTVRLPGADYTLTGRIERVDGGLARDRADVVIETVVDAETAQRLAVGDTATVADHETAEVASVTTYATRNPDRVRAVVGLSLRTLAYDERERFGTAPVQRGARITVDTGQYTLSAPIQRTGTLEPAGTATTRTVTLRLSDVREDLADAIEPGMTEQSNGATVARVTAVGTEPSLIITTGENGSVNVVDHPFLREVTLTTDLRVRETTTGPRFKGEPLRQGSTVVIDLGTIVIEAEVVSVSG